MIEMWVPFIVAALLSLIFTPFVRRGSCRFKVIDVPKDERRVHKKPIPLAGGLAMYGAFVIGVILFIGLHKETIALLIGATIITISGFIDDYKGLSPKGKLLFQGIAAIILLLGDIKIEFFTNPFIEYDLISLKLLAIPFTIFWIMGITNTINLIDGLDGLAAGVSMICAISFMFIANRFANYEVAIVAAILAGVCLGFLPYNFNPASIFMGDTGALFLGFVLSYISIEGVMKSAAIITILLPVIILGVPVFDTTFAMLRRMVSGRNIMSADKGHLHHRLLSRGMTQRETVTALYVISVIFGVLANTASRFSSKTGFILSVLIILGVIFIAAMSGMFKSKEEEE
ncbi:MAG: MraY family glycosyltransferase [Tissierellia bacterium]|nr:MraY family glycosyltransferase [Tissierellia bacterium]